MNIFKVVAGQLFHIVKEEINTGSKNFFKIQFIFDESSWANYPKARFAEFYQDINSTHFKISIDNEGYVNAPTDIITCNLPLYVGVSAENESGNDIANTDFKAIKVNYGANTNKDKIAYPEVENNYYALFSPNTKLRYLRINNDILEYSSNNVDWEKVSNALYTGLDEEDVREIIEPELAKVLQEAKDYADNEIATFDFVKIVDELPEVGLPNREYFVRKTNPQTNEDLFDEWAWINKGTEENPNYGWEFKGTKKFEVDLNEYVKFTDYATSSKFGVLKVGSGLQSNFGQLLIKPATRGDFENRMTYSPVTGSNLEDAMYVGITGRKTTDYGKTYTYGNQIPLTDEEKGYACKWLGALQKSSKSGNYVYTTTADGIKEFSQIASAQSIAVRAGGGTLDVGTPQRDAHATNKKWVEDYHAKNRNVFNITQIDTIYSSLEDLQTNANLGASGNGMVYLVMNDTENAIYSYSYDSESGTGTWTKKDDLKSNTTYVVLGGRSRGIFRFTMAKPYLIKAEQMQVIYVTNIDTIYESVSELPQYTEYKYNGTEFIVIDDDKKERAVYSYVWNSDNDYYWYKLDDLREHSLYVVHGGEKKGIYRYTMSSPYLISVETLNSAVTLEFRDKDYSYLNEKFEANAELDSNGAAASWFNRLPQIGDKFFGVGTTKDKYSVGFTAQVTRIGPYNNKPYVWFKFTDLVVLHNGELDKQVEELKNINTYMVNIEYTNSANETYELAFEYDGVEMLTKNEFLSKLNVSSTTPNTFRVANGRAFKIEKLADGRSSVSNNYVFYGISTINNNIYINIMTCAVGKIRDSMELISIDVNTFNSDTVSYSCTKLARFM